MGESSPMLSRQVWAFALGWLKKPGSLQVPIV